MDRVKAILLIFGIILMTIAGVLQVTVLGDLYIVPKEELGPLLLSGLLATVGFGAILIATRDQEPPQ